MKTGIYRHYKGKVIYLKSKLVLLLALLLLVVGFIVVIAQDLWTNLLTVGAFLGAVLDRKSVV